MASPARADDVLYERFFPKEQAAAVAQLICKHQDKEARIVEEWYARCASSFGVHHALSRQSFEEIWVPGLKSAHLHLCAQDAAGFVTFGRQLGERLARADVPFVAYVAYLHFLRQSYAAVLGEAEALQEALDLIDTVHSRLVTFVADGYYRTGTLEPGRPDTSAGAYGMVGRSAAMQRVFVKVERIARNASPVLILGETGTGKELVARAIHAAGARSEGPFIPVNCAALPRELIESELFGYRRGAFSGAATECLGLFRAAAGGTLLLDEVTEMVPELQAKLLRVLQDRTVRPVGAVHEVPVDVRIIASTNRDPEAAMASGVLRPDLYYRLSSGTVHLPPLRERPEDIPLLAAYGLGTVAAQHGERDIPRLSIDALDALVHRPWPGNVRELFNVLEEAYAMRAGIEIAADDLPHAAGMPRRVAQPAAPTTLSDAERTLIEQTLVATGGNKVQAARRLGISRTTLYAKMTAHGLVDASEPPKRPG